MITMQTCLLDIHVYSGYCAVLIDVSRYTTSNLYFMYFMNNSKSYTDSETDYLYLCIYVYVYVCTHTYILVYTHTAGAGMYVTYTSIHNSTRSRITNRDKKNNTINAANSFFLSLYDKTVIEEPICLAHTARPIHDVLQISETTSFFFLFFLFVEGHLIKLKEIIRV